MTTIFIDPKRAVLAVTMAILVFSLSYISAPIIFDLEDKNTNSWNFLSPSSVSASMEQHIDQLVYSEIRVGTISSTYTGDDTVIFGYSPLSYFPWG